MSALYQNRPEFRARIQAEWQEVSRQHFLRLAAAQQDTQSQSREADEDQDAPHVAANTPAAETLRAECFVCGAELADPTASFVSMCNLCDGRAGLMRAEIAPLATPAEVIDLTGDDEPAIASTAPAPATPAYTAAASEVPTFTAPASTTPSKTLDEIIDLTEDDALPPAQERLDTTISTAYGAPINPRPNKPIQETAFSATTSSFPVHGTTAHLPMGLTDPELKLRALIAQYGSLIAADEAGSRGEWSLFPLHAIRHTMLGGIQPKHTTLLFNAGRATDAPLPTNQQMQRPPNRYSVGTRVQELRLGYVPQPNANGVRKSYRGMAARRSKK
ncbi:hypothetical protein B0A50_00494 [Salinomyces thailandicus]|uniref:Uncharacterized protein n=1 Tax=Salinomyces thailandicus TaxID=706561 RepID=A0A4U0UDS5_9PEZI|nr:hypothetical protein B0A50_00494 [Salinomyces thailandica]